MIYLILSAIVFLINVMPGLMPATWAILAFFFIKFGLQLLPTVILGAIMATMGRWVLAKTAKRFIRPHLSVKTQNNMAALGRFLTHNRKLSIPLVFAYAFLPIPSNQVFIAAGLSGVGVELISFSFLMGRLISYTFWVKVADKVTDNLNTIIVGDALNPKSLVLEAIGLVVLVLIMKIPWSKWLPVPKELNQDQKI